MDKALFITDLDGTLLNNDSKLSSFTINTINELISKGMKITYATASAFARSDIKAAGINWNLPIITYNGAITIDPISGNVIKSFVMKKDKINDVIDLIKKLLIYPLVYTIDDKKETVKWIRGKENKKMISYIKSIENSDKIKLNPVLNYDDLFNEDMFYITYMCDKKEMDRIREYFESSENYNITKVQDSADKELFWLEIFDVYARKDLAILDLKKSLNVNQIISFGDNLNDIPMFNVSDESYVVLNGTKELKEIATGIIDSNYKNGVAKWLLNYYNDFEEKQ